MTIKQQGGIFGRNPTFNDVDVDSSINLGDGVKLNFGDGDDLVIQHQGSYSIIEDKGTGNLLVKGTNLQLKSYSTNEMYIEMTQNGAVDLYYDGVKQAYTSSVGLAFPSGKGIDFSATSGTGTSELFSDYEEGTWTPTDASAGGLTFSTATGTYTKIGDTVILTMNIAYPTNSDSSVIAIGGAPFTAATAAGAGGFVTYTNSGIDMQLYYSGSSIRAYINNGASVQNLSVSGDSISATLIYRAA